MYVLAATSFFALVKNLSSSFSNPDSFKLDITSQRGDLNLNLPTQSDVAFELN